ncbi:MAG: hypothetical protein AVDCRST_MAG87-1988 [uncultured Thermomicrobiales bacterium]|uniref:O-antigen ligase-related domain-containing protein n=1 Tax=uncultured Thermomicrobiales bacterium TaxID=1645740 RepID=A0A6J4V4P8_9BACT|nr:MAG: hypothetical protein AVDCRST_MAG87-1988 [uncultured Thermomicrobiales bacterium]
MAGRRMRRLAAATVLLSSLAVPIARGDAESPPIAAVILALMVVVAAVSPGAALGAAVLALPTAYELFPLPGGTFSLLEVSVLALVSGLGIRLVTSGRNAWRSAWHALSDEVAIVLPAVAIVPVAGLAYFMLPNGGVKDVALREIRLTIVEPLLVLGGALIVLREGQARRWAWVCGVVIGTAIAAGACVQVAGGFGGVDSGALTRATGIYSHPNNLALFLERTLLLSLPALLFRPREPLLWLSCLVQGAGFMLTFSRGGLLAVGVGVGILLLMLGKRQWFRTGIALTVGVAAVLFVLGRERLFDLGGSGSEPTRFAIWRSSMRMLLDHPVFGVGPDQFLYQYGRRYIEPSAWPERYTSHPHNIVLDVWLRLGAAGVGAFAVLATGVSSFVWRMRTTIRTDPIACGAVAALAGGAAHGLVDNGFFLPDLAAATWIAIAMLLTLDHRGPDAVPEGNGADDP